MGSFILLGAPWTLWFYLPVSWYFYLSSLKIIACSQKPLPTKMGRSHTSVKEDTLRVLENPGDCFQFKEIAVHHDPVSRLRSYRKPGRSTDKATILTSCPGHLSCMLHALQLVSLTTCVFISWAVDTLSETQGSWPRFPIPPVEEHSQLLSGRGSIAPNTEELAPQPAHFCLGVLGLT